jgi:MFS family permease
MFIYSQWLIRLFFQPSVWRDHLATNFNLSEDFSIADLSYKDWRNSELRSVLIIGLIIVPLLLSILVGLLLWLQDKPFINIVVAMTYTVVVSWISGFIAASQIAVGFALISAPLSGLVLGLAQGEIGGLVSILGAIFVSSLAGHLLINIKDSARERTFSEEIGAVVFGLLVSVLIVLIGVAIGTLLVWSIADNPELMVYAQLVAAMIVVVFVLKSYLWFRLVIAGLIILMIILWEPSIVNAITFSLLFALSFQLTHKFAGTLAAVWAGILTSGGMYLVVMIFVADYDLWLILITSLIAIVLGLSFSYWRVVVSYPLLAAWHLYLYQTSNLLDKHAAFWDEYQFLPWFDLKKHILKLSENDPQAAQSALIKLSGGYNNWVVPAVQLEWDTQRLEQCKTLSMIALVNNSLITKSNVFVRRFSRLSEDLVAALNQSSDYNKRLLLRNIEEKLDDLLLELNNRRFQSVAVSWRQAIIAKMQQLAEKAEQQQEIHSPYITGLPLQTNQELFVGREDISAKIENFLRSSNTPPLLLYGQRRMGKTSLLYNIGRLLPSTIIPLFVPCQGVIAKTQNTSDFFFQFAKQMINSAKQQRDLSLPKLTKQDLQQNPIMRFSEWLEEIEQDSYTLLLMLDEFVELEKAFEQQRLEKTQILGWLRDQIEHHQSLKILFSGSYYFNELESYWSNYLINVKTIHISYLQESEARQLIRYPIPNFNLHYTEEACQHILTLTCAHPALVQLMCDQIIQLKNQQVVSQRQLVEISDVEASVANVLEAGKFFFNEILQNQIGENERKILSILASDGELDCPDEKSISLLLQRELIERVDDGGYRFQVELIRRLIMKSSSGF